MSNLEDYINKANDIDGLVRAFMVHYQFETIHPFLDGNGRIGRLLLSLHAYHWCKLQGPWLYLSAYFDRYKDEYIDKLFRVSTNGDWNDWIRFCLRATKEQALDSMRRIDMLLDARRRYEKLITDHGWPGRLHQIVTLLLADPITDIPTLAKTCKVTYPTAKADVNRLQKIGVLEKRERLGRSFYYAAPEIFRIAYMDSDEDDIDADPAHTQQDLPL